MGWRAALRDYYIRGYVLVFSAICPRGIVPRAGKRHLSN